MAATSKKVVSIQAKRKKGHKSAAARLQAETLRAAWNHGAEWSDDDADLLVNGILNDHTSAEMAFSLGRSYYSVVGARAHMAFAMRHMAVLKAAWRKAD